MTRVTDPLDPCLREALQVAPFAIDAHGFFATRHLPDGRWLVVEPQTFGAARLCLVGPGPELAAALTEHVGYLDTWDYAEALVAIVMLRVWDGHGEPRGWQRHAATGRRRQPDGTIAVRPRELPAALIAELRAEVAAGAGHDCHDWWGEEHSPYAGRCVLCDRVREARPA